MDRNLVVTIDGPMASGKSTVTRALQERMSFQSMNTGAFYRASTYIVHAKIGSELPLNSLDSITDILEKIIAEYIPFTYWKDNELRFSKPREISARACHGIERSSLFNQVIDANVSLVSCYVPLREAIRTQVRNCVQKGRWVIEGRDAGTQIYPEAALKIYLDASVEVRAQRRYQQYHGTIENAQKYREIQEQLRKRDFQDANKGKYSLKLNSDLIYLNSTKYTLEQILKILYTKLENCNEK